MYQIKNWDEIYENSRSRIIKDCRWVPVPNKQDGLGYSRLITGHGNGAAHYGVWVAIVCLCSRQKMPRMGHLTDDGKKDGIPLTTLDISLITRIPENHIVEALPRFVEIGWMSSNNNDMALCGNKAALQGPSKEGNRKEGKGIEKKTAPKPAVPQSGGNASDLLRHFGEKYKEYFGCEYNASFAKEGKLLKDLIAQYDYETVFTNIDKFFEETIPNDRWAEDNPTVGGFKTKWNSIQSGGYDNE